MRIKVSIDYEDDDNRMDLDYTTTTKQDAARFLRHLASVVSPNRLTDEAADELRAAWIRRHT